ncbi:MAG: anaerobic sulfatase-maturation protein [Bacteroidales bacterium]|nr:anaerobic sulfatase-maturation protein [Bacteroidales bacterium]
MAKPVGSLCNLSCKYCYYLEKGQMYQAKTGHRDFLMDEETLETFIHQYIDAQTQPQVLFTWHGGEPLMRPLSFYRRVMELQQKYAGGRIIDNCIQTNGILLNDEWCRFFRDYHWLVGVSIDGPQELHDEYRRAKGGTPSFRKVMRGISFLQKYGVEWNVMGVVNDYNADHPLEVYHFYKETGCHYIQFTPVVERILSQASGRHLASVSEKNQCSIAGFSVQPGQYAHFVNTIFDEWVRHDVGSVFVQLFDSALACWVGQSPGVCSMGRICGHAAVMEHNGDVYACDHFVFPEYLLGNIRHSTIAEMMYSVRQRDFGKAKRDLLPEVCRKCTWLFVCNGGCPKDRFCTTPDGSPGLNYLCRDYRAIFEHVAPYMDFMAEELRNERPPMNVMNSELCR